MDNYKLTGKYYPPSDYEANEGRHPQFDYSKNGKCDVHGAFNNHYKRNCPVCSAEEQAEYEYDRRKDDELELALFDRAEARAINKGI
jgi:hypothetical protein